MTNCRPPNNETPPSHRNPLRYHPNVAICTSSPHFRVPDATFQNLNTLHTRRYRLERGEKEEKIFYLGGERCPDESSSSGSRSSSIINMHSYTLDDVGVEENTSKGPPPKLDGYALSLPTSDIADLLAEKADNMAIIRSYDPGPGWTIDDVNEGDACEFLDSYGPGGHCPILRHDVVWGADILRGRKESSWFRVVQKLGAGGNAAVWLVKDM